MADFNVNVLDLPFIMSQLPISQDPNSGIVFTHTIGDDTEGVLSAPTVYADAVSKAVSPASILLARQTGLLAYASQKQNLILSQIWSVDVGAANAPVVLTTRLDTEGQSSMLKMTVWGLLNTAIPASRESYSNVDFGTALLTPIQAQSLGAHMGAIVSQSYSVLNTVAAQIQASSPTITTTAQIDAAGWPKP